VEIGTRCFGEHKGPDLGRYKKRHLYFESGSEREVKVRFGDLGAAIAKERWPDVVANADGTVTLSTRVTPGNYLYGWVLGFGGQAEIEAPVEAREGLGARVRELQALYGR
jgi:predicted DNA-binding transcriptional regulator YafY